VTPRQARDIPDSVITQLLAELAAAGEDAQAARDRRKRAVVAALKHASIRQIADVTGLSPTTVHAWSRGRDR